MYRTVKSNFPIVLFSRRKITLIHQCLHASIYKQHLNAMRKLSH